MSFVCQCGTSYPSIVGVNHCGCVTKEYRLIGGKRAGQIVSLEVCTPTIAVPSSPENPDEQDVYSLRYIMFNGTTISYYAQQDMSYLQVLYELIVNYTPNPSNEVYEPTSRKK